MQITTLGVRSTLSLAICLLGLSACVYEIPIQQGNYLDATALVQVKKGMTRAQVRYLLGTPMVPGGFDNDRWDYDYYLKLRQFKTPRRARAAVYFQNDLVDRVDSDVMPVATDFANNPPGTAPVSPPNIAPANPAANSPATGPQVSPPNIAPANPAANSPAPGPQDNQPVTPVSSPGTVPANPATPVPSIPAGSPPPS